MLLFLIKLLVILFPSELPNFPQVAKSLSNKIIKIAHVVLAPDLPLQRCDLSPVYHLLWIMQGVIRAVIGNTWDKPRRGTLINHKPLQAIRDYYR